MAHKRKKISSPVRLARYIFELILHPATVTVERVCTVQKISRRTCFRDIRRLREAGIPVVYDAERRHFRIVNIDESLRSLGLKIWPLSWEESVILFAVLEQAQERGKSNSEAVSTIARKLAPSLEAEFGERAGSILAAARVLRNAHSTSVSEARRFMEEYWARQSGTKTSRKRPEVLQ